MHQPRATLFHSLRRRASRLLPVLFLGLVSLQAQATCVSLADLQPARADAHWVMHGAMQAPSSSTDGAHAGRAAHHAAASQDASAHACPNCNDHLGEHGDCGDGICVQQVTDTPAGALAKSDLSHAVAIAPPPQPLLLLAASEISTAHYALALDIPERPPQLRYLRFLE